MEKKILLLADHSIHSKYAVQYAVKMSSLIKDLSYTLFHIQPCISQFLEDEAKTDFKARSAMERLKEKNARDAVAMLEKYKADMIGMGVPEDRIDLKTDLRKIGLAKDVIDFAQKKRYDAIVAGRRGLSRVQEVFMGSLTAKLIEHSQVIPVWVVDNKVSSQKIMIAIDGSESALRAVDHVSFMLRGNPNGRVTLFHVIPRFRDYCAIDLPNADQEDIKALISLGDKKCIERFMVQAYKKFREAGISEDQIEIKQVKKKLNVGRAIAEEAQNGDYGTIVVGRRGADKAFFMGNVSLYILDKISGQALWLVS